MPNYNTIEHLSDIVPGTAAASKAVILGPDSKIDTLDVTSPKIGGTAQTATAAELIAIADLSVNLALIKTKVIPITTKTTAEIDTGVALPAKAIVLDVYLDVQTAEVTGTTKTITVGTLSSASGGVAAGFANGISTATKALVRPGVTITAGVYASTLRGTHLASLTAGTNADDRGIYQEKPFLTDSITSKNVSYTLASTHTELVANIIIVYVEVN